MKTIKIDLPEKLAVEIENYIKGGWFTDTTELMCAALREFIRHRRPELMEKFMQEDIEWALRMKEALKE
ncbi:CopG family transcriptional regulator [Candidatus Aerophobetes bacterium]|nr:CopG family transcriptional regulator [Candidatus Aerophobetes bacterium]